MADKIEKLGDDVTSIQDVKAKVNEIIDALDRGR